MSFQLQSALALVIPEGLDLTQKMSIPSLICAGLNLLLIVAVPLIFFVYLRKYGALELKGILVGGLTYILMNKIVLSVVLTLVFMIPAMQVYLNTNLGQMIQVAFAFIIEFLAIFFGLMWMRRKSLTFNDCLMFLFGYSCIIILTETVAQALAVFINCISINTQGLETIFAQISEADATMAVQAYKSVLEASPADFMLDGINCVFQFFIRVCSCILIYGTLSHKIGKQNILLTFIGLLLYHIPIVAYTAGMIQSSLIIEAMLALVTGVLGFYTSTVLSKELGDDLRDFLSGKIKKSKSNKKQPPKMPKIVMPKD